MSFQIPQVRALMPQSQPKLHCSLRTQPALVIRGGIESQPGCRGVELLTDPAHPCVRGTLSRWDAESDLDAYRSSALFGEIWPATKAMFDAPPMVWTYEVREAG